MIRRALLALLAGLSLVALVEGVAGWLAPPGAGERLTVPEVVVDGATVFSPAANGTRPFTADGEGCVRTTRSLSQGTTAMMHDLRVCTPPAPGTLRIAVVGGSEVYGIPYSDEPDVILTGVLRRLLERALPGRPVEVLNLGLVGQESSAMLAMVREVAAFRPDMVVFGGGGADVRWYYERAGQLNPGIWAARQKAERLATLRLLRRWTEGDAPVVAAEAPPTDLADRKRAELRRYVDRRWALEGAPPVRWVDGLPERTDPDWTLIVDTWAERVEAMEAIARAHGFRLIVAPPAPNLHVPAEVSLHDPRLDPVEAARLDALVLDPHATVDQLRAAVATDPTWGKGHFALAVALQKGGGPDEVWRELEIARRLDYSGLAFPPELVDAGAETCARVGCRFVDSRPAARAASTSWSLDLYRSPGHFSKRGNAVLGESLARAVLAELGVEPGADWALPLPRPDPP